MTLSEALEMSPYGLAYAFTRDERLAMASNKGDGIIVFIEATEEEQVAGGVDPDDDDSLLFRRPRAGELEGADWIAECTAGCRNLDS